MRKSFLIGNFLPAYGSGFGRMRRTLDAIKPLSRQELEKRFDRLTWSRRKRNVRYLILLQTGAITALGAAILAFNLNIPVKSSKTFTLSTQEIVTMEEIAQTTQKLKPPPPMRPPVPVVVPDDLVLDTEEFDFDALLDLDEALAISAPPPPSVAEETNEPEIFVAVESMPELVGGIRAILAELRYPAIAQMAGISGTVVVQIVVGVDGRAHDPVIFRGIQELLDEEALRAVMLQKFVPGKQRGRAVPVYMNIPVTYRLK